MYIIIKCACFSSGCTTICGYCFPAKCSYNYTNIYVQFIEIKKCVEHHLTLQIVYTEFVTTASSFSKIFTNHCFHHVYSINTNRTTWKYSRVYFVSRGSRRGHIFVTRRSKNVLFRNPPVELKRAAR